MWTSSEEQRLAWTKSVRLARGLTSPAREKTRCPFNDSCPAGEPPRAERSARRNAAAQRCLAPFLLP